MTVGGHHQQRLGVRPAQALDGTLVPCDAAQLLTGQAVYVYRWLGGLAGLVSLELGLIRPKR